MPSARAPRGRQQAGAGSVPTAAAAAAVSDGRATELDFESVLDAKQALERQLDPALHAVELLEREKEKLERELERDYEALRNLESSAKAQGREYRGLLKKAHVLAPTPEMLLSQRKKMAEQDVYFNHSGSSSPGGLFSVSLSLDPLHRIEILVGERRCLCEVANGRCILEPRRS
jgi:hypothetical protein